MMQARSPRSRGARRAWETALAFFLVLSGVSAALGQTFDAGSDGSDGTLTLTNPGVVDFDPVALGLDADGDGAFHFEAVTIGAGVTVRLTAQHLGGPVFWLSQGAVQIDGDIALNGEDGLNGQDVTNAGSRTPPVPGAGGFSGGLGAVIGVTASPPQSGGGPGAGSILNFRGGGGGGYQSAGAPPASDDYFPAFGNPPCTVCGSSETCTGGGPAYGSAFIVPLAGGSGGAGGHQGGFAYSLQNGGTGGAGGGALLIASSVSITLNGTISANGGKGGDSVGYGGGGGSGGAIRLAAPEIAGSGALTALGGARGLGRTGICPNAGSAQIRGHGGAGSKGRIRIEAFTNTFSGSTDPAPVQALPFAVFLPDAPPPMLQVVSVAGIPVVNPSATFTMPDVEIDSDVAVPISIEARNIPDTAVVELTLVAENAADQIVPFPGLSGTPACNPPDSGCLTSSVDVLIPSGFSRGFVRAQWDIPAP